MASTSQTTTTTKTNPPINIIPCPISSFKTVGILAARAYWDTPLFRALCPAHHQHPNSYRTGFQFRALHRLLAPQTHTYLAVLPAAVGSTSPDAKSADSSSAPLAIPRPSTRVVAYITISRLGASATAQSTHRSHGWLLKLADIAVSAWEKVYYFFIPDKSVSWENLRTFEEMAKKDAEEAWSGDKFQERWHVVSLVVDPEWQGRGIGKRLIRETVLTRARREGVSVALEASPAGRRMYETVRFRLWRDFTYGVDGELGGGIMVWEEGVE